MTIPHFARAILGTWHLDELQLISATFSETKLEYLHHIQYRPNPLAN